MRRNPCICQLQPRPLLKCTIFSAGGSGPEPDEDIPNTLDMDGLLDAIAADQHNIEARADDGAYDALPENGNGRKRS